MVTVPRYERDQALRPAFRQGVEVSASPQAFGSAIGQGLQQAAQGVQNLAGSLQQVQELEDITRAKEADNGFSNWVRERQYGENGFMTLQGKNAVDQRAAFEREAEEKRKEFGKGLTPGAAKAYTTASQARIQSVYQQSIVHTAGERKRWFGEASNARIETFSNDALANFNKPELITKNIGAGIMELREQGAMQGWDKDTLTAREREFVSGVHKNITLRLAQDDPLAADAYMKGRSNQLTGADTYALEGTIRDGVRNEQAKREAEAILTSTRAATAGAAPVSDGPAGSATGGSAAPDTPRRTAGQAGPTKERAFLHQKLASHHNKEHVDGLDENFATNLSAMLQDAPAGIREGLGIYSGYRSIERQKQLWENSDKTGKWVARPGKSFHNHGKAVDLSYNGRSLKHAPKEVVDWVHSNAKNYGLYFPMSHENWHIEPMGTRGTAAPQGSTVQARTDIVAPRAMLPSASDQEARLAAIADPEVRERTRKILAVATQAQDRAMEANEKAAKAELWRYVDQGATPDQVPLEIRQAAGMSAVSSAWNYLDTASKGRAVDDDQTLAYDMRRFAATDPKAFGEIDLNDYRDRLSKETIKEMTGLQTGALTDQRKAREDGLALTSAFSQATQQLQAVGITATGKKGDVATAAEARIAQFNNILAGQMDAFKRLNDGRNPNQMEIQKIINQMLLPIAVKTPGSMWGTNDWRPDGVSGPVFGFEAGQRPDNSTVEFAVEYKDIPIDLRRGISVDLERELGRKPSEDEVVTRYEQVTANP